MSNLPDFPNNIPWCVPGCWHHNFGKFEDCVTEALWRMSLDSGQDGETGSSVDWDGWYALFHLDAAVTVDIGTVSRPFAVNVPAGSYILYGASGGEVSSSRFARDKAQQRFDAIADRYFQATCDHEWVAGTMIVNSEDNLDGIARMRKANGGDPVTCQNCDKVYTVTD